jgi:hypothetical protein
MAFDLTKPSMTDADWPTFAANIRENFRAIVQGDDNVFTSWLDGEPQTAVAVAAGFGTTPTIALDAGSTDNAGIVTVTAGTTPGATGSVTVTFGTLNGAYGTNTPTVVITPLDGTGAWDTGVTWKLTACSTTAFTVAFKNAATNFTAASTYRFSYHVIGK